MISREIPWKSQPQVPIGVDWTNPITQDSAFGWVGSNPHRELLKGAAPSTDQTAQVGSSVGLAAKSSAGQVNIEWPNTYITTSNGVGTGDFALLIFANPNGSGAGPEHMLAQKNDAGGSPFAQCALFANAGSNAAYVAGSVCFFTYNNTNIGVTAAGACDGKWHVFVGVRRGYNHEIWRDGILLNAVSNAPLQITQANRYTAIGSRGNGTTESYTKDAALAWAWNRALKASEIAELSANPWQLFQPRTQYIPVSAAGGTQAESGGSSASVVVTAIGAGTAVEITSGGSSASVLVTAVGTGTALELASGGASTSVVVTAVGGGNALETLAGGSSASVVVTAVGAGLSSEDTGVGVYPSPATVLAGVQYGPNGVEYTGTMDLLTAAEAAQAVAEYTYPSGLTLEQLVRNIMSLIIVRT